MKKAVIIFFLLFGTVGMSQNLNWSDKVIMYFKTSLTPFAVNNFCELNSNSVRAESYNYKFETNNEPFIEDMENVFLNEEKDSIKCNYCDELDMFEVVIVIDFIRNSQIKKTISFRRNLCYIREDGMFGNLYFSNNIMRNWFKINFPRIMEGICNL